MTNLYGCRGGCALSVIPLHFNGFGCFSGIRHRVITYYGWHPLLPVSNGKRCVTNLWFQAHPRCLWIWSNSVNTVKHTKYSINPSTISLEKQFSFVFEIILVVIKLGKRFFCLSLLHTDSKWSNNLCQLSLYIFYSADFERFFPCFIS